MSARLYRLGETKRFLVDEATCLSASCFDPCVVHDEERGRDVACCRTRMLDGCPENRGHTMYNAIRRGQQGWRAE